MKKPFLDQNLVYTLQYITTGAFFENDMLATLDVNLDDWTWVIVHAVA